MPALPASAAAAVRYETEPNEIVMVAPQRDRISFGKSGDGGIRTRFLLVASEALVQSSYVPKGADGWSPTTTALGDRVTTC